MIIEPTSLEGMVWRDHLSGKGDRTVDARQSECMVYHVPEDSGPIEQIPLPSVQPRAVLPIPAETTDAVYQIE
jgi:hypothetical protein